MERFEICAPGNAGASTSSSPLPSSNPVEEEEKSSLRGHWSTPSHLSERSVDNQFAVKETKIEDSGNSLEQRPGILMIGSPNVGKRTILSRLLSSDCEDASNLSSEPLVHGWTIDTKYYTTYVSIWTAHLHDRFSVGALPVFSRLAALVMVFDMSEPESLTALQDWVSRTDIQRFDILVCIGNKVDLVPGHLAHVEYRRRLLRLSDSDDPYLDLKKYGLSETEGCSLLQDEEPSWDVKRSCMEWCSENHIEYIEACASNADFDKCLSVDGDSQGVDRIYDALSAHMWPGMILKSGNKITKPSFTEKQDLSEEESDYEIEYEILSAGSAEQWDDGDVGWVSADGPAFAASSRTPAMHSAATEECNRKNATDSEGESPEAFLPLRQAPEVAAAAASDKPSPVDKGDACDEGKHLEFEDLDQLMCEIGHVRDSLRLIPDFQRREMAAELAMKMATMFGGRSSEEEEGFE